jgi:hypothetical protein
MDQNVSQDKNPVNVTEVAESDHNDVQDAFHPSLISASTHESRGSWFEGCFEKIYLDHAQR